MRTCLKCHRCACKCKPEYIQTLFRDDKVLSVLPGKVVTARGTVTLTPGLHAQVGERVLTDPTGRPLGQTPQGTSRRRKREEPPPIVRRVEDASQFLYPPQGWPGGVVPSPGNERYPEDDATDMITDPAARWIQGRFDLEPGVGYTFVSKAAQGVDFPYPARPGNILANIPRSDGSFRVFMNEENFISGEWRGIAGTPNYMTPNVVSALIAPPWTEFTDIQTHAVYTHRGSATASFNQDGAWGPAGPYFLVYNYEGDPTQPNNQFIQPAVFIVSDGNGGRWRYYLNRRNNFQGLFWVLHATHFLPDGSVEGPGEIVDGEEDPTQPGENKALNYVSADTIAPEVPSRYSWSGAWDSFYYLSNPVLLGVSADGETLTVQFRRHRFEDGSDFFPSPDPDAETITATLTPTSVTLGGSGGSVPGDGGSTSPDLNVNWPILKLRRRSDFTTLIQTDDVSGYHTGCTATLPAPYVIRSVDYLQNTVVIGAEDVTEWAPLAVGDTIPVLIPGGDNSLFTARGLWNTSREEEFFDALSVSTGTIRGALPRVPGGAFDIPPGGAVWDLVMPPEGQADILLPIPAPTGYARVIVYANLLARNLTTGAKVFAPYLVNLDDGSLHVQVLDLPLASPRTVNVALRAVGTAGHSYRVTIRALSYQLHKPQGV